MRRRQRWIDFSNRVANRAEERFRCLRRSHVERGLAERLILAKRRERERSLLLTNMSVFLIFHDAHYFDIPLHSITGSKYKMRAHRTPACQISLHKRLVDDGDFRTVRRIVG